MKLLIYKLVMPDLRDVTRYLLYRLFESDYRSFSLCVRAHAMPAQTSQKPLGAMSTDARVFAAALSSTREIYIIVYILKNILRILCTENWVNAFVWHSPKNEFDLFY